jgi:hypothetical protein
MSGVKNGTFENTMTFPDTWPANAAASELMAAKHANSVASTGSLTHGDIKISVPNVGNRGRGAAPDCTTMTTARSTGDGVVAMSPPDVMC